MLSQVDQFGNMMVIVYHSRKRMYASLNDEKDLNQRCMDGGGILQPLGSSMCTL